MDTLVPGILFSYLMEFRGHFGKASFGYFSSYVVSLLLTSGRKTMSRVAGTCFWVDRHLASWERFLSDNKWDSRAVVSTLVGLLKSKMGDELKVQGAYLAAVDTLLVAKNGNKMLGVQKWKDHSGNADRGESIRGHHWALLGLIAFSSLWDCYVCFPVLMQLISGQINPYLFIVDPEGVATLACFWDSVHPLIWQLHNQLNQAPLRVVADAYFGKAPFIQPLLTEGIHVVTRLRKDAVAWDDPSPDQRSDAKRGKKWKLAHWLDHFSPQALNVHLYGKLLTVNAVCREVWLRDIDRKVKVVVVEGLKKPILLVSTDLSLTAAQIIEIYGARFTIEIAIRDLKQHFGLADYQCYLHTAIHRFAHLACLALSLFRLIQLKEDTRAWLPPVPKGVSPTSFSHLRRGLQRFIISRILSPHFDQIPKSQDTLGELDAVLRVAG